MPDLDQQLADGIACGRLTDEDAATVFRFRDYLRQVGPRVGPLTVEQQAFRRLCRTDPEWQEFLGIAPCGRHAIADPKCRCGEEESDDD